MQPSAPLSDIGLVIGKFMPPHKGHQHLIEFARNRVGHLTVLLFSRGGDPIPGELRFAWMKILFPDTEVLHIRHELPTDFENPTVWDQWIDLIQGVTSNEYDVVFSSESYGEELATRLGARHEIVDSARAVVPVSASLIRTQPLRYKQYIPDCVWPYFDAVSQ